ncbi:MAG: type II toxin-antitoxin system RelE/ParE family toxin [Chloroflexi bacterium]|nr:type II toxin-antitoxin system RelE/ParE family toxin [Chloroflexota bacterium]
MAFAASAQDALAKLTPAHQRRIRRAVDGLGSEPRPRGAVLLTGTESRLWRIRVGDYRAIYAIDVDRLEVLVIGARIPS